MTTFKYNPNWRDINLDIISRLEMLNHEYLQEPWGKLAAKAGFEPVNVEGQARDAFRFCAEFFGFNPESDQ